MGVDVDEVLTDFISASFEVIRRLYGRIITEADYPGTMWDLFQIFPKEQVTEIFAECEKLGFCRGIPVLPGSVEAVVELRRHVELFAVTSHFNSRTWVYERDQWLKEHFGFDRSHIVHTSAKYLVKVDVFLDDNPSHVRTWKAEHPNGLAMLWPTFPTRNMTGFDSYRVTGWDDVVSRVSTYVNLGGSSV